jgi:multiple sugar transport system substrate-binding protein
MRATGTTSRKAAVAATLAMTASLLAACGGDDSGPPTLTWYTNPDSGGQAEIADKCTQAAGGKYTIETSGLPTDATAQREQLVRRLAGSDSSVDLMSLDPPFVPEFSTAGFLAPIPEDRAAEFTEGIVESAVTSATWEDELVVAPFWANTQLLWYRKSVAEAAGLDMSKPVTWDQIVQAAESEDKTVAVQALLYEGYTVWINALVESAGASVLVNPEAPPDELELGLDSPEGEAAAQVIEQVTPVGGAAMSTQDEEGARRLFQGDDGGFLVNWPYVWAAWQGEVEGGTLDKAVVDDIGWTRYPEVSEGQEARPPLGGIQIGIGAFTDNEEEALDALACIVSVENQKQYMLTNGNPAAAKAVYEDPEIKKAYPMADAIVESLDVAAPRPLTPYYTEVSSSLQREFHPPSSVTTETPASASEFILAVINGEALL